MEDPHECRSDCEDQIERIIRTCEQYPECDEATPSINKPHECHRALDLCASAVTEE